MLIQKGNKHVEVVLQAAAIEPHKCTQEPPTNTCPQILTPEKSTTVYAGKCPYMNTVVSTTVC